MTANDILQAIASIIVTEYPTKSVYTGRITSGADGNFFVRIANTRTEPELNDRVHKIISIEIIYFVANDDSLEFNDVSDTLSEALQSITVTADGKQFTMYPTAISTFKNDTNMYQIMLDISIHPRYKIEAADEELMEKLYQNNTGG